MEGVIKIVIFTILLQQTNTDEINSTTSYSESTNNLMSTINEFGYKLLIELMENNENKNILISPTGVAGLLTMALLGSVGKTYDELATALGFSQDILANRRNHEEFGKLLKALSNSQQHSKTLYANVVVVNNHTRLRTEYHDYLSRVYDADAFSVDFTNQSAAKTLINQWVSNHTEMTIQNFIREPIAEETQMVLLSALYFSGQWLRPFIKEHTKKLPFRTPSGEISVDMMLNFGEFSYVHSKDLDLQMIAFPYIDETTTMYVLKPLGFNNTNLLILLKRLNYSKIYELIEEMTKTATVVRFPKMQLENNNYLQEPLKALGLNALFNSKDCNLALMVENPLQKPITDSNSSETFTSWKEVISKLPNPGIHVDSVIHDVKIVVDEYGTKAVAATAAFLARTAEMFYADTPFFFFIRNEVTKLVTFSAAIFDPTN